MVHADNAMSIPRTMNALQDCIKCIEVLCMMYIGHVVLVCGGIMRLGPVHELNMENQNR